MLVGGIVLVGSVRRVTVARIRICRISPVDADSTHGTKVAVCASYPTKVEEMQMLLITTQMAPLTSEFGKLTTLTGANAVKEKHPVTRKSTSHVLSRSINGEAILSSCGLHILLVAAENKIH